jgi:TolB protein
MSPISQKSRLLVVGLPAVVTLVLFVTCLAAVQAQVAEPKLFERRTDVGKIKIPGSAKFDPAKKQWRITASGANIWGNEDAFYFVWRKVAGNLTMTAHVAFAGQGKNAHRKAGWMVRQGLDADVPYAGVSVHGDGLITLHYRREKGGPTLDLKAPIKGPALLRLERRADVFTLAVAKSGQDFQPAGAVTVQLKDPVYAGLFNCSHDAEHAETAIFANTSFENVQPKK